MQTKLTPNNYRCGTISFWVRLALKSSFFKNYFLLFFTTVFFITGICAQAPPRLKVSGNKIVDPCGNEVMLKGFAMTDPGFLKYGNENNWGTPSVNTIIDRMTDKTKGFYGNTIRMQIEPVNNTSVGNQFYDVANHETWFNTYIKPAVDYITNKGLYVIIDWHYINNTSGSDGNKDVNSWTREFWTFMAPKLKDYTNVIYEVFNEPIDNGSTWSAYKSRVQPWVDIIRNAAPNTPIMVGGPVWSQEIQGAVADPINGGNIIYVTHIYTIHNFSDLSNKALQVKAKYPVVLGECGWDSDPNGYDIAKNRNYPAQVKKFIDDNHIGFLNWWAFGGNFDLALWQSDWITLRGGSGYAGETMLNWLTQYKDSYNAASTCSGGGGAVLENNAVYEIESVNALGKALDVSGAANGAQVQIWSYGGGANQKWKAEDAGNGYYRLTPQNSTGSCLDAGGVTDGANIQIWGYAGTNNQKWKFEDAGGGYYYISPSNAVNKCLDVTGSATADGTKVQLYTKGTGANQKWKLTKIAGGTTTVNKKYEAENATLTGVNSTTSCSGYSGSGYVTGLDASGDKIDFTVNVPTAGNYKLTIRYALCSDKTNDVKVNGTLIGGAGTLFSFNNKACCTWQDKPINISLNAGNNTISIVSNWGYTSIDYIFVSNTGASSRVAAPMISVYPNLINKHDNINLRIPAAMGKATVELIDFQGRVLKHIAVDNQQALFIPTKGMSAGVYFIRATDIKKGKSTNLKIVLQ